MTNLIIVLLCFGGFVVYSLMTVLVSSLYEAAYFSGTVDNSLRWSISIGFLWPVFLPVFIITFLVTLYVRVIRRLIEMLAYRRGEEEQNERTE